jgi:IS605 OrfB family transposase
MMVMRMMQRTYETRLPSAPERNAILDAYAELYGRAERTLFARLRAGDRIATLKSVFMVRFGLTARQFNALAATVQGKVASVRNRRPQLMATLERRLARAHTVLSKFSRETNQYHQKRRRVEILTRRLAALRTDDAAGCVRLCFGSRKLFRAQFALKANGYASHGEWRRAWRGTRASQVFVLGSKDETAGCQGCVATIAPDGTITLRLRLPDALAARGKHLVVPGLRFGYGHETIVAAIGRTLSPHKQDWGAISWRFVRDRKGWRVGVTVSVPARTPLSVDNIGVIGVDLNTDHLAVTDLDRFGNPVASFRVPCVTRGKTRHQSLSALGDAVAQIVSFACCRMKPIIIETLDFEEEKAEVERHGTRRARLLSGFAYAAFHAIISARTYDAGIRLLHVNPAYTSVIGQHAFADRYGLSRHQAAACAIGRRGMHLAERPTRRLGDHVTFPLPVRNRGKHVWSFWRQVARREAALRAHGRPGPTGVRSSPAPALRSRRSAAWLVIQQTIGSSAPSAGETPARESSAALFG